MKIEEISQLNYVQIRDNFLQELIQASQNKQTSISYITTTLSNKQLLQKGTFQAIVIGGTHYETNIAEITSDGTIQNISSMQKGLLPKLATEEIFLATVEKLLDPAIHYISLNLAYHLQPFLRNGILDGKITNSGKEHAFKGMLNKPIGETLEAYIKSKQKRDIRIITANDAVCLVLAGLQSVERANLASCIVGSGFNMALFTDDNTIINLQSGSFNKFSQTPTGKQIDLASMNPGRTCFEKEVSGLYLYQHYNLLQKEFGLQNAPIQDSKELSDIATGTGTGAQIAQALLKRSASLVAAQIAAVYTFKGSPPLLTFVTEGSVFRKGWHYEQMVQEALQKLAVPSGTITFLHLENSSLLGASHLLTATIN